jgi:hypothetical protein
VFLEGARRFIELLEFVGKTFEVHRTEDSPQMFKLKLLKQVDLLRDPVKEVEQLLAKSSFPILGLCMLNLT